MAVTRIKLGVNVDHVATVRQARRALFPKPADAAVAAWRGGADGITVHLREDRRHIQPGDVLEIKRRLSIPLNLEMAAAPSVMAWALRVHPEKVCLVPERREELTTEGGLNVVRFRRRLGPLVKKLSSCGIAVSLFVEPDRRQIEAAAELGARFVELHTGRYANRHGEAQCQELKRLFQAAEAAHACRLGVNAGHGLDYENVSNLLSMPHLYELNIGFSIVAEALWVGMEKAVRRMKGLIRSGGPKN